MKDVFKEYKKITVEIPLDTYYIMDDYCRSFTGRKNMFFCDLINLAILDYCRKKP